VNETAGDGLMVIFHEGPHARSAVDAAQAIHRRAAEIGAELSPRFEPLAIKEMHVVAVALPLQLTQQLLFRISGNLAAVKDVDCRNVALSRRIPSVPIMMRHLPRP